VFNRSFVTFARNLLMSFCAFLPICKQFIRLNYIWLYAHYSDLDQVLEQRNAITRWVETDQDQLGTSYMLEVQSDDAKLAYLTLFVMSDSATAVKIWVWWMRFSQYNSARVSFSRIARNRLRPRKPGRRTIGRSRANEGSEVATSLFGRNQSQYCFTAWPGL